MARSTVRACINPFALAEQVAQKKIRWEKYEDQYDALCGILNISRDELFSVDCPLITPFTVMQSDGTAKQLDYDEAKIRLEDYLAKKMTRRINKKPPMRSLTLKTIRNKIPGIVLPPRPTAADIREIRPEMILKPKPRPPMIYVPEKNYDCTPEGYEWIDMGDYFINNPSFDDPIQGAVSDCYLLAMLSAVAWTYPELLVNVGTAQKPGDEENLLHTYIISTEYKTKKECAITEKTLMKITDDGPRWVYARSKDEWRGEIWPAVFEKAFAKYRYARETDKPDMTVVNYGVSAQVCTQFFGGEAWYYEHNNYDYLELLAVIKRNCNGKKAVNPMMALTYDLVQEGEKPGDEIVKERQQKYDNAGIVLDHFYTILGWEELDDKIYLILRNPHGQGNAQIGTYHGTWDYGGTSNIDLNSRSPGIFALEIETFAEYFQETSLVCNLK